jgi:hypothetical protein
MRAVLQSVSLSYWALQLDQTVKGCCATGQVRTLVIASAPSLRPDKGGSRQKNLPLSGTLLIA